MIIITKKNHNYKVKKMEEIEKGMTDPNIRKLMGKKKDGNYRKLCKMSTNDANTTILP